MTTEPTRFTTARDDLRDRVLQRTIHPQAAAQQLMEMTLRAIGGAQPNVDRDTLVWMAQQAVFFVDFCRQACTPVFEEPVREKVILYTDRCSFGTDYLRANDLNPQHYEIVTISRRLEEVVRGTTGRTIVVLNDHPIELHTWPALEARGAKIERVTY